MKEKLDLSTTYYLPRKRTEMKGGESRGGVVEYGVIVHMKRFFLVEMMDTASLPNPHLYHSILN